MLGVRALLFGILLSAGIVGLALGQSGDNSAADQRLQQAQATAAAAHLALTAAKEGVQTRLKADPTYLEISARLKAAQAKVDQARESNSRNLQQAAVDKMSVATELSSFVGGYAASDPVVRDAQAAVDSADAAVAKIRAEVNLQTQSQSPTSVVMTVESNYDKFNDKTIVGIKGYPSFSDFAPIGEMELSVLYTFKGPAQSESPKDFTLLIFSASRDWVFDAAPRDSLGLILILDGGRKMSLRNTYFNSKVVDSDFICHESLGYDPTYEQLKAIANAKKVEAKIFVSQFNFTPEQISAIRDLVATIKPPKPTTMPNPDVVASSDTASGWSGTGFLVSADGLVLTNRHVAVDENNPDSVVRLDVFVQNNDRPFRARIVGVDKDQDLALIKIQNDAAMPFIHFSAEDFPSPGSECNILGFPLTQDLGMSLKITHGSITSVHQSGADDPWATEGCDLMMDAKSNPGNSGGPLLNQRGDVVGILAAKTAAQRFQESYTIGISAAHIRDFMRRTNVAIPASSTETKDMRPEDIFKMASPSVVRIRGQSGN